MSVLAALLLAIAAAQSDAADPAAAPRGRAEVWRLDRVETLDGEPLENVALVVREGLIEKIGQAIIVPEGARLRDLRGGGQVATPPLVLAHANFLVGDQRGNANASRWRAVDSLWLAEDWEKDLLREGVLFAGVDPPGGGLPGRSSVLEAGGGWPRPAALVDDLHLKVVIGANAQAKDLLRKALKDADAAIEKEKKAREEWEKARAEWDKKQKEKAEKEKQEQAQGGEKKQEGGDGRTAARQEEEEKPPPETFEPPAIAPDLVAVVEWVRKERVAQVWLSGAADYLHWRDVLKERELPHELVIRTAGQQNFHEVAAELAKAKVRIEVPAAITMLPFTRTRVNLPAELAAAGVKSLVLAPGGDGLAQLREWRIAAARVVAEGLPRRRALEAMTLEPARALGLDGKVQALKAGAPANFTVWSGDPLDPMARALFVVRDGKVVWDYEREKREEER